MFLLINKSFQLQTDTAPHCKKWPCLLFLFRKNMKMTVPPHPFTNMGLVGTTSSGTYWKQWYWYEYACSFDSKILHPVSPTSLIQSYRLLFLWPTLSPSFALCSPASYWVKSLEANVSDPVVILSTRPVKQQVIPTRTNLGCYKL